MTPLHSQSPRRPWNSPRIGALCLHLLVTEGFVMGRGILLWLLGVPIPIILLLALIWH
jgi:hypothetical protein